MNSDTTPTVTCLTCGNPNTIPADPNRPEEHGNYCEDCGSVTSDDGQNLLI